VTREGRPDATPVTETGRQVSPIAAEATSGWLGKRGEHVPIPLNIEAEQRLLGCIFIRNDAFNRVAGFLRPEHFANALHSRIYTAIGHLISAGAAANPVTLKDLFDQDDALRDFGGAKYLARLSADAAMVNNAQDYAGIVVDLANRREFIAALEDAFDDAVKIDLKQSFGDVATSHQSKLAEIIRGATVDRLELLDIGTLTVGAWLKRDIPAPDFLLADVLSSTSRALLAAPTGLGKTMIALAIATAIANGPGRFLHWEIPSQRRVLYIDGEMSARLMKTRVDDVVRRSGAAPANLFILNREDFPDMPPLNTEEGQRFIDRVIGAIGQIGLIVFDNIQSLLTGSMIEEDSWADTLPWIRSLTQRKIGQLWVHHTGYDETHGYGTSTRDWQFDTGMLLERVERPETDLAFIMKFTKARERTPDNRTDFEPTLITLVNDQWSSERGGIANGRKQLARDRALDLLKEAIARGEGQIPPANGHLPPNTYCVTEGMWRRYYEMGSISEPTAEAKMKAFKRAAGRLIAIGAVGKWELWVWPTL
jgi:DnaB helicase-like protein/AAA domain-containing protein